MAQNNDIKIGKFTLESLTTGMYSDPLVIYREYIQNATDAIDVAVQKHLLQSTQNGQILISVDPNSNTIRIEDNGNGIQANDAWSILCDIGNSMKHYETSRGFRGIGRLGGISYCDKLIFETSAYGENTKSIITWECSNLRKLLVPGESINITLEKALKSCVSFLKEPCENDSHFFKVSLLGVSKDNFVLIDLHKVKSYIMEVAPIPFNCQKFYFYSDQQQGIEQFLKSNNLKHSEYKIYFNDDPNPLNKCYKSWFKVRGDIKDDVIGIETFIEKDENDNLLFWGWYTLSGFRGAIKEEEIMGIRLRKDNIQIGDAYTMDSFFIEGRFNRYYMGEVHILSHEVIPNARRDNFEQNEAYANVRRRLEKITKNHLSKLVRQTSAENSQKKQIYRDIDRIKENNSDLTSGLLTLDKAARLQKENVELIHKVNNDSERFKKKFGKEIKSEILTPQLQTPIETPTKPIVSSSGENKTGIQINEIFSHFPRETRKVISKIFSVIERVAPTNAKDIILSIINTLKRQK